MKKIFLLLIGFFTLTVLNLPAANRYWVAGTGNWTDLSHWASISGGVGGASIPTSNDDVFFDQHSFSADMQAVIINSPVFCHNLNWSAIDRQVAFSSLPSSTISLSGSYISSPLLINAFKGQTKFASNLPGNIIETAGREIIGNWIFDGTGAWTFMDDLITESQVSVSLIKGNLNTNGKKVVCGSFIGSSTSQRSLNLSNSEIVIKNNWDFNITTNLNFNSGSSILIFEKPIDNTHFKSGNLTYNSVTNKAPATCVYPQFTIHLTETDVTCNGLSDGTATVTVTPGTSSGPFQYLWFTGGFTTATATGYGPSNYTVRVTDSITGVWHICSISIAEPSKLFVFENTVTPPMCFGLSNGSASVDGAQGVPPYNFLWNTTPIAQTSNGVLSSTATSLAAGTYTVTITDTHGCKDSTQIVVTQPQLLVAPGSSTNISCNNACDGTATVVAAGGTTNYTYVWTSTPATVQPATANISNLCPGTYTCTVTDAHACVASYNTTITQPNVLTLATTQINVSCGGLCDASATATITGGTAPYTYAWSCGGTSTTASLTNTANGLCAGPCTITVTDAHGCTINKSIIVTQPPVLIATATGTNISCFNSCDGTATSTVTGGTSTYSYVWSSGQSTPNTASLTNTINALCAISYTVTVTDLNGCTDTGVVALTQPTVLDVTASKTNVICFGACNGTATASPTGGTAPYTYFWKTVPVAQQPLQTVSNLCPGTYTVIVTDAHLCKDSTTVIITQPTDITTITTGTSVTCFNACDGTAIGTPSGGTPTYTYSWTGPAIGAPAGNTQQITNLCNGTYTLVVTDFAGCKDTTTVALTQPNPFTVTITNTPLLCNGHCNSVATTTVFGGTPTYSYSWTSSLGPNPPATSTISSLCAGTYTVTVTDFNLCKAKDTVVIIEPALLVVDSTVVNATCFNTNSGSACGVVSGGTPGYTYSWAPGPQITQCITNQTAGTYTLTVTDLNGCKDTSNITITEPNLMLANPVVISPVLCNTLVPTCDGLAYSSPTGGTPPFTYSWNTAPLQLNDTASNLCIGTWSVTVTDTNGCVSTQSIVITQPTPLSANISNTTSSCNVCNGTATVTPSGGTGPYTYSWLPAPGGLSGQTATGLCSGVLYTVTITDLNGCTATRTVSISQTVIISITTTNTVLSCFGSCDGVATANASGGSGVYDYFWGPGTPSGQGTPTITNLCAGTYWVTATDTTGCFNTDTIVFSNPALLVASATSINETCFGLCNATATGSYVGGTGPINYLWSDGSSQTTAVATNLCIGTYTLTVTDSMACSDTAQVIITQPTAILDNYSKIDATCLISNGSITVAPTGGSGVGYTYVWTGSAPITGGGTSVTNLAAGTYTLVITDGAGCSNTFNYFINNTNAPSLVISSTPISCFGACNGTATVVASGGAGSYVYNWTPGNPIGNGTAAVTSLCSATYTVNVTDALGCIEFDTISVLDPALISPNPTIVDESCGGSCNGSITLNPTGGNGGYTYAWTNGLGAAMPATSSQSNLCATLSPYTVTVTDTKGCDSVLVINIISPPTLTATIAFTNVNCFNACDGTATVTPSGGTPPYSHSWSHGAIYITPGVVNLCPGTYTDTVTDFKGCTVFVTATITEPTALTASSSQVNVSCYNLCDGTVSITASGGTLPYSYSWNPIVTTNVAGDNANSLCAGTYNLTVTDGNGCQLPIPAIVISEPTQINVNVTSVDPTCNSSCNGTATSTPSGGSGAGYTYLWNTLPVGQITQTATTLCAATYNVIVTDGAGCSNNQNVTLTDPPVLSANVSATPAICNNSCNGSVIANPVGGTPGYTYLWTPGLQTTQSVINECPKTYTVVVTDSKLCTDTQTVVVANPLPINALFSTTPATCGFNDGTLTVTPITGTPGYAYVWSPSPGAGNGTANGTLMFAGIYSITVTDTNSCDSTFVIGLNNAGGPTGEIVSTTDLTCNSVCSGIGSVDVVIGGTPPFTFLWNNAPINTANDTATNLCAGNYLVQVTDSNSCIHFSPITINEPLPIVPNAVITDAACSTVCNGAITVTPTGGTGAVYNYSWAPGNPAGQGTATITSLCPGTYTLTISDVNLCTQVDSFVVGQSAPLNVIITSTNSTCSSNCNGSSYLIISSGTSPYAIQWNDPLGQVNDTATALCAGTYTAVILDALGCSTSVIDTITSATPIVANALITNATCGACDGEAVLSPTGGTAPYTYVWSNVPTTFAVDSNLCAGLYTVDITDSLGCVVNVPIPVSNSNGPTSVAITSTNASCFAVCDGAVTGLVPTGGTPPYTYLWIQSGATTTTLNNLCAGVYFVQVKDSLGCSLIDSVTITEPSQILANQQITAATCGVCNGGIVIVPSGGIGAYTAVWSVFPVPLVWDTLTNLCAGVYSVQLTDANGCGQNVVIPVNNFNGPSLTTSITDVTCNGMCDGTATVTATGGLAPYTYLWNDALPQITPTAGSLCPGTYFVQVTGADLCVSISSAIITEPTSIGFSAANINDPLCNADTNGSISIFPSGGVLSYTYSWTLSSSITNTATNLGANTYITTVTDANGCIATQTNTLTDPPILTISNVATSPSCNTISDGAIDVTVGGGTPTYGYQWTGASVAVTEDLTNVLMGAYTIIVTDANGCTIKDTVTLTPTTTVIANAGNDTSFCMLNSVSLNATGSTNGTNYNWYMIPLNTNVGTGSIISVTPSDTTTYYVVVDNGAGCADNDTINVLSYPLPVANAGADITILTGASTTIGGSPTGPTGSTYLWIPLPGLDNSTIANPLASPSSTTTYSVVVTSAQGCVSSDSVVVSILPNISFGNGISPNGDGVNDEWEIDFIELFPENTVEVYNRWGELLFQSKGYKEKWDGKYKGQPLPVGTYYYIINLNDPLFPDAYTGPITIMR